MDFPLQQLWGKSFCSFIFIHLHNVNGISTIKFLTETTTHTFVVFYSLRAVVTPITIV